MNNKNNKLEQNSENLSKNVDMLDSFIDYCMTHPEERFWQAIRNWAKVGYILATSGVHPLEGHLVDTFYFDNNKDLRDSLTI